MNSVTYLNSNAGLAFFPNPFGCYVGSISDIVPPVPDYSGMKDSEPRPRISGLPETPKQKVLRGLRWSALLEIGGKKGSNIDPHVRTLNAMHPEGYGVLEIVSYLESSVRGRVRDTSLRTIASRFKASIRKTIGPEYRVLDSVKSVVDEMLHEFISIKAQSAKRVPLNEEQVFKLIKESGVRTGLFVQFLSQSAMRVTEACKVQLSDIIEKDGVCYILVNESKTGDTRIVVCDPELIIKIKEVFSGKVRLFETATGGNYDRNMVSKLIRSASRRIIGRAIGPHILRHTFATHMAKNRPDLLPAIIRHGGWKDAQTFISTYTHQEMNAGDLPYELDSRMQAQASLRRDKRKAYRSDELSRLIDEARDNLESLEEEKRLMGGKAPDPNRGTDDQ